MKERKRQKGKKETEREKRRDKEKEGEEGNTEKEIRPIVFIEILRSAQYLYQGDTVNNVTTARKRVRYPRA